MQTISSISQSGSDGYGDGRLQTAPPLHRAIDYATALKVELRRMRRAQRAGSPVGEERLAQLELLVDQLAGFLIEAQEPRIRS